MPLLDHGGEAQTSSRSLNNSEPDDATARSHHATAGSLNPDASSKGSSQQSSIRRHGNLSPLPEDENTQAGALKDQTAVTRSITPEPAKAADKLPSLSRRTSPAPAQLSLPSLGNSGSQGQAALEQAGKFRAGAATRQQHAGRQKEEREQARTGFAAATMRRFRTKLEGLTERPGNSGKGRRIVALSVKEQVEKVVQQAISIDNLSQMYEGWTPWI